MYKHITTRQYESKECPGVVVYLHKMTEGRRLQLRSQVSAPNRQVRDLLKQMDEISKSDPAIRDDAKWIELSDQIDDIVIGTINPAWILWGVKKIEGLTVDEMPLDVKDWQQWPSNLFNEVLGIVKEEAELNGAERKNLPSDTTSGELGELIQSSSIVQIAGKRDTIVTETVESTTLVG